MADPAPHFAELREGLVEARLASGAPLAAIEPEIDATAAAEDDKAALWLFAWALEQRRDRGGQTAVPPLVHRRRRRPPWGR